METIYYTTLVANGFDDKGYYQRANLLNNLCSTYQIVPQEGCSSRFEGAASASAAGVLRPRPPIAPEPGKAATKSAAQGRVGRAAPGRPAGQRRRARRAARPPRACAAGPPRRRAKAKPDEAALDYLLGGGR